MQIREIQLSNPTRRPLSYAARLEGASDFSLEASLVKIDPGQSTQVSRPGRGSYYPVKGAFNSKQPMYAWAAQAGLSSCLVLPACSTGILPYPPRMP